MIYTKDKYLIDEAIKMGCKTAAQFAQLLKVRNAVQKATS